MPSFPVLVLGFLFVPFRPSSLHSHSCSTSAYLVLSLSVFSASLPVPFVPFRSASGYSAFCSSFPSSSRFCLAVASPVLRSHFRSFGLPRSSQPGFPCLLSRFFVLGFLFVSFHPSRLRSHSCSTGASLLFRFLASASYPGFSACFPPSFVRFSLLLTTQPSALSFPLFPISPGSGSLGALRFLASPSLSSSVRPVSMPSFRFRYSASCNSFLRPPSRLTVATSAPQPSDFSSGLVPLAFALGSGYSACPF